MSSSLEPSRVLPGLPLSLGPHRTVAWLQISMMPSPSGSDSQDSVLNVRQRGQAEGAKPAYSAFNQGTQASPRPTIPQCPICMMSLIGIIYKTGCQVRSMCCGCWEFFLEDPGALDGPEQNRTECWDRGEARQYAGHPGGTSLCLPKCSNLCGKSNSNCLQSWSPPRKMNHWIDLQEWRPTHQDLPSSTQEAPRRTGP